MRKTVNPPFKSQQVTERGRAAEIPIPDFFPAPAIRIIPDFPPLRSGICTILDCTEMLYGAAGEIFLCQLAPVPSQQPQCGVFARLDQSWEGPVDQVALVLMTIYPTSPLPTIHTVTAALPWVLARISARISAGFFSSACNPD